MSFVCLNDFQNAAFKLIPKNALDYYKSGAGDELTLRLNQTTWDKIRIRPRILRDVTTRDLSTNVLGLNLSMPLGIAPTAMQRMAHPDGEIANAKAAGKCGIVFTLSTIATSSIEELGENAPNTLKWFQLYIYKDRELTRNLVKRAEKANFKALVLTVDAPIFGLRRADMRNKFTLPSHLSLANFSGDKAMGVKSKGGSGINEYVTSQFDPSLTWDDVIWLKSISKLPLILKGILTAEDAILAADAGVDGIIVSNHGARQIDSTPSTIEALPEISKAVGHRVTVMLDGGIRQGTDIFKALALGAKLVFIGRPAIWGLSIDGEKGVEKVIEILRKELDVTMTLMGCTKISDITRDMVVHENNYSKL
uniref:(S)-2-hydroxy-acid oxidase n=1 Tax=Culicoides sonorensis TaxID=179676 RepID=A0A336MQZ0_CULSO